MSAYYNEFDPFAAAWLRELIKDGLIADGVVDERSIEDVQPEDLREFKQCHFFAGIGGWSYAARLARWADDRPMWTGSPPCQPFSSAGNRKGKDDLRHLWPVFFNLIRECQPPVVFGEQVASAIRMGWFDDLQTDMENEGYATGMVVLPANFVGAPHKRERLFYVAERMAYTSSNGWEERSDQIMDENGDRVTKDGVKYGKSLVTVACQIQPWLSPTASTGGPSKNLDNPRGVNAGNPLATATAMIQAWPTPMHTDGTKACNRYRENHQNGLGAIASTVEPWATPTTRDYKNTGNLENYIFGSPTGRIRNDQTSTQAFLIQDSSTAETTNTVPSQLNPRFSLWLMGYPIGWAFCGERVTPLSRKSAQK